MSVPRAGRVRSGFTLVEILVALVVLEVGLLGVVGTLVLAARTLTRAEVHERGVAELEQLWDSLRWVEAPGSGARERPWGVATWAPRDGGLSLEFLGGDGRVSVRAEAAARASAAGSGG